MQVSGVFVKEEVVDPRALTNVENTQQMRDDGWELGIAVRNKRRKTSHVIPRADGRHGGDEHPSCRKRVSATPEGVSEEWTDVVVATGIL